MLPCETRGNTVFGYDYVNMMGRRLIGYSARWWNGCFGVENGNIHQRVALDSEFTIIIHTVGLTIVAKR